MRPQALFLSILLCAAQITGAATVAGAQESNLQSRFRAYSDPETAPRISNFSGMPVPRYASLHRTDEPIRGRAGPSTDYPVEWKYELDGLPVIIVRETRDWRKIRDPHGDEAWVHRSLISGDRTVMAMYEDYLRRTPEEDAAPTAHFQSGVVFTLHGCEHGWCRLTNGNRSGWTQENKLWGSAPLPGEPR